MDVPQRVENQEQNVLNASNNDDEPREFRNSKRRMIEK